VDIRQRRWFLEYRAVYWTFFCRYLCSFQSLQTIAHHSASSNNFLACIYGAQQLCHFLTFDSLQDTVIATQAMSSVAGLLVNRTQDLTIAVSHSEDKTFSRSFHITPANSMVFNQVHDVSFYSQLLRRIKLNRETRAHCLWFFPVLWRHIPEVERVLIDDLPQRSQPFSDHVPLQHLDRRACTLNIVDICDHQHVMFF